MRRHIILVIVLIALASTFVFHSRFALFKQSSTIQDMATNGVVEAADISIQDMYLIEQKGVGDSWKLFAREASFYDTKQLVLMHNVRGQLVSNDQSIDVEADYGQFDNATGNISVHGRVQLKSQDYTIETDVLHWHASSRVLQSDTSVRVASAFVQITGEGLHGHPDQQNFVVRNDVHASFQLQ